MDFAEEERPWKREHSLNFYCALLLKRTTCGYFGRRWEIWGFGKFHGTCMDLFQSDKGCVKSLLTEWRGWWPRSGLEVFVNPAGGAVLVLDMCASFGFSMVWILDCMQIGWSVGWVYSLFTTGFTASFCGFVTFGWARFLGWWGVGGRTSCQARVDSKRVCLGNLEHPLLLGCN